jgi:hypothetical protein
MPGMPLGGGDLNDTAITILALSIVDQTESAIFPGPA